MRVTGAILPLPTPIRYAESVGEQVALVADAPEGVSTVGLRRVQLEAARREILYQRMGESEEYAGLKLLEWEADTVAYIRDCCWAPDQHGDLGGGVVPFTPYPEQEKLIRKLDWIVATTRRRDGMGLKSRQVGYTTTVLAWLEKQHRFATGFPALLASYEEEKIDKGGKHGRSPNHLFGKIRFMMDELIRRLPLMAYNRDNASREPKTFAGHFKSQDSTMLLTRPEWRALGQELFPGARGNTIQGDLPDDTSAKSLSLKVALLDEIGDYKVGMDEAAWDSIAPCCRHIFAWGTIPDDARENCLLYTQTDEPPDTLTALRFHWTRIPLYMEGSYWECPECDHENKWPFGPPGDAVVRQKCVGCGSVCGVDELMLRSEWFNGMCSAFRNDPVKIARYLQMDWYASAGDVAFYTFSKNNAVVERLDTHGWEPRQGFDPGVDKKNPAAWVKALWNPVSHKLRFVAYWMRWGVPVEWWVPFMLGVGFEKLRRLTILSGPHVGKKWLEAYNYNDLEKEMIERSALFDRGVLYGDRYGDSRHAGAEPAYDTPRRYGVEIKTKGIKKNQGGRQQGKWGLIEKARDLYVPSMEIDPVIAGIRPYGGGEKYPTLVTCWAKIKMQSSETGQGEATRDFNKRSPKHLSHPIDASLAIINHLPNEIRATVDMIGDVRHVPASGYDDDEDRWDSYGESLPGATW